MFMLSPWLQRARGLRHTVADLAVRAMQDRNRLVILIPGGEPPYRRKSWPSRQGHSVDHSRSADHTWHHRMIEDNEVGANRMVSRPMGSPSAPPPRSRYEPGKPGEPDALSVALGVDDEKATTAESPTELERIEARILGVLGNSEEPVPIDEIARKVRLDFLPLSRGLVDLRRRGAIILRGSPGSEVVSLRSESK